MNTEQVITSQSNGVLRIILNRPEKYNSLNEDLHHGLSDAIRHAQTDSSIRCVLLTGSGRAFCAGQDLGSSSTAGELPDIAEILEKYYTPLISAITTMDKPVICAVNGVAAGAGANIALACDIVVAGKSASFIQAFSKIGLIPDAGGTWMLPRLIGHARATAVTMLGTKIDAEKAANWGMIWEVVEDDDLQSYCEKLALDLASQATTSLAFTKRLLQLSWDNPLPRQLELEAQYQIAAAATNDFKEGVDAFMNKRKATFLGK